jgi:hypothetical protein
LAPLAHATPAELWYKTLVDIGYGFGPSFRQLTLVESVAGQRASRAHVSLAPPPSTW